MASRKHELTNEIQDILTDAIDRVKDLVKESLTKELGSLMGGGKDTEAPRRGRKPGRPAGKKAAKKAGRKPGRPAKAARTAGKPGRRSFITPEKMAALTDLVNRDGEVIPKEARKVLRLTVTQMQTLARNTAKEGKIKVVGAGRGTRYVKA